MVSDCFGVVVGRTDRLPPFNAPCNDPCSRVKSHNTTHPRLLHIHIAISTNICPL